MAFIDSNGVKLFYEDVGRGRPIVFVHEFAGDYRAWEGQVRHFSRAWRCVAFNARGYPPSSAPDDPAQYGWEYAVDDIAAVMRALDLESAHIVGLSMGAYAALRFGLKYRDMATAIVAAAGGSGSPPAQREAWIRDAPVTARGFLERGMKAMAEEIGAGPTRVQLKRKDPLGWRLFMEQLSEHSEHGMANTMARFLGPRPALHELVEAFAGMTTPVLLAVGDEDAPALETNLMLKTVLPNAGLWICPNSGHAINLEEPAAFNGAVESFLTAVERGSWRGAQ